MIRFLNGTDTYGLGFKHMSKKEAVPLFDSKGVPQTSIFLETLDVRYTVCTVYRLGADNKPFGPVLAQKQARCSPLDNYVKETGRKVALTRTLAAWTERLNPVEGRTLRAAAWNAYFERNEEQDRKRRAKELKESHSALVSSIVDVAVEAIAETHADGVR